MKSRRFSLAGLVLRIIALLILVALAGAAFALTRIPSLSEQIPANSAPLQVVVQKPGDGESFPVSGAVPIQSQATGAVPLTRLELWADGMPADNYPAPVAGLYVLDATWHWTPQSLGTHTLLVRAYDLDGHSGDSNVVHLQGVPDPGMVLVHTAVQGDSLAALAQADGVDIQTLLDANPGSGAQDHLPPGTDVFIPLPPPAYNPPPPVPAEPLPEGPTDPGGAAFGGNVSYWLEHNGVGGTVPDSLPQAPSLQASISVCTAKLVFNDNSDNENGFFVYRLAPQAGSFVRVATLAGHNGSLPVSYTDPNLRGDYQYYVAAFNVLGETESNIAAVSISDPGCGPSAQVYKLEDLIPGAGAGLDDFYLYLNTGKNWIRVPRGSYSFMDPSEAINIGLWVSPGPPDIKTFNGEAWGWRGGALTSLGPFKRDVTNAPADEAASHPAAFLLPTPLLEARGVPILDTKGYNWRTDMTYVSAKFMAAAVFHWNAMGSFANGRWQVSIIPFSDQSSLNPPGLLLTGDETKPTGYGEVVEFPIDLSPLVTDPPQTVSGNPQGFFKAFAPFAPLGGQQQAGNPGSQKMIESPFVFVPPSAGGNGNNFIINPGAESLLKAGLNTFYLRILPMNGNQVAGKPSNTVVVHYDPGSAGPEIIIPPDKYVQLAYEVKIIDFTPMNFPNPDFEFCDEIVSIDSGKLGGLADQAWNLLKPGDHICPTLHEPESSSGFGAMLSDIGHLVESGVNFISEAYDKIDAMIKDLAAKLNPFCIQAKFIADAADKGQQTVDDVCHAVASIAVDAAKAYFGIPPSLPNYDQLTGMGEDYVVELAADELDSKGIPCPEECKQKLREGLDYTLDQIKKSQGTPSCSTEAEQNGFDKLCPPDGVVVKPDPRGQYAPAILTVQLTRPDLPEPSLSPGQILQACNLQVIDSYTNDFWSGKSVDLKMPYGSPSLDWQGTSLSGKLFAGSTMAVPVIDPGASITLPVQLDFPRGTSFAQGGYLDYYGSSDGGNPWLPGHEDAWKQSPYVPDMYIWQTDWWVRYHGALVTLKAHTCGDQGDQKTEGPLVMPLMESQYGSP